MEPRWQAHGATLYLADCREAMAAMPEASVDAIVTDPPAGIAFMGRDWDRDKGGRAAWIEWMTCVAEESLRVAKPGTHALVWALPRTSHWTATAWEDAGWEIRDRVTHLFGSGFPKSLSVSKAIDRAAGADRQVVGTRNVTRDLSRNGRVGDEAISPVPVHGASIDITAPATDAARQWEGWGTALKPAAEDWWLLRKPLQGTVAANVLRWHTGALNIEGTRISGANHSSGDQGSGGEANARRCAVHGLPGVRPTNEENSFSHRASETPDDVQSQVSQRDDVEAEEPSVQRGDVAGQAQRVPTAGDGPHGTIGSRFASDSTPSGGVRAPDGNGAQVGSSTTSDRDGASQEWSQGRQPSLQPRGDGLGRALEGSPRDRAPYGAVDRREPNATCTCGRTGESVAAGRWPSNVVLDEEAAALLDASVGELHSAGRYERHSTGSDGSWSGPASIPIPGGMTQYTDSGGPSRFFFTAKASRAERELGLDDLDPQRRTDGREKDIENPRLRTSERRNDHPCVKPTSLMRWLCTLITPPGGVILDPFMGSGSTGVAAIELGFQFIGIDMEDHYVEIARRRMTAERPMRMTL